MATTYNDDLLKTIDALTDEKDIRKVVPTPSSRGFDFRPLLNYPPQNRW